MHHLQVATIGDSFSVRDMHLLYPLPHSKPGLLETLPQKKLKKQREIMREIVILPMNVEKHFIKHNNPTLTIEGNYSANHTYTHTIILERDD